MYEDKLDGRITPEQFDRKAKDTRSKQQALRTRISEHQTNGTDLRAGFNMMRFTSIACREFERQNSRERRKLLELVVAGAVWKDGQLDVTLHEPFRTLALSNSASATKQKREATSQIEFEKWLPSLDSNQEETSCSGISKLLIRQSATSQESRGNNPIRTAFVRIARPTEFSKSDSRTATGTDQDSPSTSASVVNE
jgi:hypothetical protein